MTQAAFGITALRRGETSLPGYPPVQAQTQFINVHVNGQLTQVPSEQSVRSLLQWLKLPSDRVAVELDRALVRKRDWEQTPVNAGAQIEIVEFVGGG